MMIAALVPVHRFFIAVIWYLSQPSFEKCSTLENIQERSACYDTLRSEESVKNMDKLALFGFLIAATSLEATGDAVVRLGINQSQWTVRCLLFVTGGILLFGYGLSVNLAPAEFGRIVGLYIAILFVMWQAVNWIVFQVAPVGSVIVGGLFIIVGGAIVTLWK